MFWNLMKNVDSIFFCSASFLRGCRFFQQETGLDPLGSPESRDYATELEKTRGR